MPFDLLTALPTQWLGYAAASCTTLSFLPQAVLTLRTRDVSGISASMYGAFTVGVALWLWYGWRLGEWPIIIANAVTLALAATILVTKLAADRGVVRTGCSEPG
ncbi:MAG: SemiSWEET transporter [Burkholderiaceae bacterium]|nr:SemiSWEET family sugar transporter [Rhodoferax sp.]MCP5287333.1 SemiSWEET transporter [Burkholderiaceae bacterium]